MDRDMNYNMKDEHEYQFKHEHELSMNTNMNANTHSREPYCTLITRFVIFTYIRNFKKLVSNFFFLSMNYSFHVIRFSKKIQIFFRLGQDNVILK
jgi:hypothetical protein